MSILHKVTPEEFTAFYTLLSNSFPSDELRPEEAQFSLLRKQNFSAFATDNDDAVITLWQFDTFAFIEHFAVTAEQRNQGLGTAVLQDLLSKISTPVCLEAELPDTDIARRRLGFYQRNGFYINDYAYQQPAYAADRNPVPLLLLTSQKPINETEFNRIRRQLYREVYHVK